MFHTRRALVLLRFSRGARYLHRDRISERRPGGGRQGCSSPVPAGAPDGPDVLGACAASVVFAGMKQIGVAVVSSRGLRFARCSCYAVTTATQGTVRLAVVSMVSMVCVCVFVLFCFLYVKLDGILTWGGCGRCLACGCACVCVCGTTVYVEQFRVHLAVLFFVVTWATMVVVGIKASDRVR